MLGRLIAWVCGVFWLVGVAVAADVPTPEAHLGYPLGADYHLAPWSAVAEYYTKVDAASDRVVVRELGKTTEGRPYLAAFVSSEANIAKLDRYREIQRTLAQPTGPNPVANLAGLVAESKNVVLITCSIHSNETASTLMSHGTAPPAWRPSDDPATKRDPRQDHPDPRPVGQPRRRRHRGQLVRADRRGSPGKVTAYPRSTTSMPGTTPTATGSCSTSRKRNS